MRQKVEIEVDVPDGMRIKCQGTRNDIRPVLTPSSCTTQIVANIILERIEPKRESRWVPVWQVAHGPKSIADAVKIGITPFRIERRDYEDGKLVAVTLEPEGEGA